MLQYNEKLLDSLLYDIALTANDDTGAGKIDDAAIVKTMAELDDVAKIGDEEKFAKAVENFFSRALDYLPYEDVSKILRGETSIDVVTKIKDGIYAIVEGGESSIFSPENSLALMQFARFFTNLDRLYGSFVKDIDFKFSPNSYASLAINGLPINNIEDLKEGERLMDEEAKANAVRKKNGGKRVSSAVKP